MAADPPLFPVAHSRVPDASTVLWTHCMAVAGRHAREMGPLPSSAGPVNHPCTGLSKTIWTAVKPALTTSSIQRDSISKAGIVIVSAPPPWMKTIVPIDGPTGVVTFTVAS
jgi:hypothetical protein